jgi:hypothetical protein
MVASQPYTSEQTELLAEAVEAVAPPGAKGKPAIILVDSIYLAPEAAGVAAEYDYASAMKLTAVLSAGAEHIFLLDEGAYNHITGMGGQEDDSIFMPESIPADVLGIDGIDDSLRFYLRRMDENAKGYDYSKLLMRGIGGE